MTLTKKYIIAVAEQNNINMERIKVFKRCGRFHIEIADIPKELIEKNLSSGDEFNNIPEIDRLIRRYNRQAHRLMKALKVPYHGFKAGSGEWYYIEGEMSQEEKLAALNID